MNFDMEENLLYNKHREEVNSNHEETLSTLESIMYKEEPSIANLMESSVIF